MQPTSSGGLRHPDASEFSEHPIKEVPKVSAETSGTFFMGCRRGHEIIIFFATYPWPSLCEQSELQCCAPFFASSIRHFPPLQKKFVNSFNSLLRRPRPKQKIRCFPPPQKKIRVIRPSALEFPSLFRRKTIKTRKSFGYLIENP